MRYLFGVIRHTGRPMTFAEIRKVAIGNDGWLSFSEERSLRRALQTMVRDEGIIALGSGGRADPHRYSINPLVFAMAGNKAAFEAAMAACFPDYVRNAAELEAQKAAAAPEGGRV
jgi:hypothetical protein